MKIKICSLLILLFLVSCKKNNEISNSSNSLNDAEKNLLISKKNNSIKSKVIYLDKSLKNIRESKNSEKTRELLVKIIYEYYYTNNLSGVNKASDKLLAFSKEANDSLNLGLAYRSKGFYFNNQNLLDSSFHYYLKAEKIYLLKKDKVNYADVLMNKGMVQYAVGDNLGADLSLNRAINIFEEFKNSKRTYDALIMLGNVSDELKDYKKAIDYFSKALSIAINLEKTDEQGRKSSCYNNLGYIYIKLNNYKEAIKNFEKGLVDKMTISTNPLLYANLIDNLAYSKLKLNNTFGIKEMFYEAYRIRKKEESSTDIIRSQIHISQYHWYNKDTLTSIEFAQKALSTSKHEKSPIDILTSLHQISEVDLKKSALYSAEYIKISDSLQIVERNSKDRFSRIQLETDEIIEEKDKLEEKNRTLLYVFIGVMVVVSLLFIVRAQRARTRELVYKQAQQKANEDIYNLLISQQNIIDESRTEEKKKIARDLHDGVLGRMFGARLNLDSLNSKQDEDSIKKRLGYLEELKNIEQDIREISHDLNREKQVLINNFVSIVSNLLEEQNSSHEAELVHFIDNTIQWDKINNTTKINMYRMLQESLQNINKYAKATQINVEFKKIDANLVLTILDNGEGFDVNKKNKGIGVQNMISRTHECNGIIDISSIKGTGTSIIITIPIETKKEIIET